MTLGNEPMELGPEMAVVGGAASLAGGAKGLARAASGPARPVPISESEGKWPSADAGEEVTLIEAVEIASADESNVSLIYSAGGKMAGGDELPQPLGGIGIVLIVIDIHPLSRARD